MRIVYHLGAHCTDEDRLIRCLLKNRAVLAEQGIVIPSPTRYRKLIRDTAVQLKGRPASEDSQAMLLEQIMDEPVADRLILSWENFLSFPTWAVTGALYGFAGERIHAFTQIFPDIPAEFHLAIRNPATFLPALQDKVSAKGGADVLASIDPLHLRWSDVIRQIIAQNPGVPMTIWCDEDTPLIWPEVLEAVSGHAPGTALIDTEELLAMIMTDIGLARMRAYMADHPPQSVTHRRRIVTAFLEKFARPEQIEIPVSLNGWTDATVRDLTTGYFDDLARIRSLPGVRLLEA